MKRKLFFVEKPCAAQSFSFLLEKQDMAILAQSIAAYKFDYKNINYSNAPYTKETPLYKENKKFTHSIFNTNAFFQNKNRMELPYLLEILKLKENKNKEVLKRKIKEFFLNFDEIIFACDYDYTGWRGFEFKMFYFFELGKEWIDFFNSYNIKISIIKTCSYDKNSLIKSFKERKNIFESDYYLLKEGYIKKDFFEYNYNLNALLFFNNILKKLNIDNKNIVLTKNHIATLFLLKSEKLTEHDIVEIMSKRKIGQASNYSEIVYNLSFLKLTQKRNEIVSLSEQGELFLSFLHKKINDPYLNIRLKNDYKELSVEDFKIKYEKYLYEVFSKQKRFLRRLGL
tara:strand:- start:9715 stop:10737 length:1023 start_codon:yes stop_codon:yes gene_type:complete